MKVGFGQAATAEASEATSALATQEPKAPAVVDVGSDVQGEVTMSDIRLPRINLANKSGKLGDVFAPGSWVLNKEHQIGDGKTPLTVIALRLKKQFQENLKYDPESNVRPRVFDTVDEVKAAGLQIGYKKDCGQAGDIAHVEFLIKAPAGLSEDAAVYFNDQIGEHLYCRVVYTAASTAYPVVGKTLITARGNHLKATGLCGGYWELGSRLEPGSNVSYWTPVFRAAGLLVS